MFTLVGNRQKNSQIKNQNKRDGDLVKELLCKSIKSEAKIPHLKNILSEIALLASFIIYHSKSENAWIEPPYIKLD